MLIHHVSSLDSESQSRFLASDSAPLADFFADLQMAPLLARPHPKEGALRRRSGQTSAARTIVLAGSK
jgi:hypothetical protein